MIYKCNFKPFSVCNPAWSQFIALFVGVKRKIRKRGIITNEVLST